MLCRSLFEIIIITTVFIALTQIPSSNFHMYYYTHAHMHSSAAVKGCGYCGKLWQHIDSL